jgi:hypothetical protein
MPAQNLILAALNLELYGKAIIEMTGNFGENRTVVTRVISQLISQIVACGALMEVRTGESTTVIDSVAQVVDPHILCGIVPVKEFAVQRLALGALWKTSVLQSHRVIGERRLRPP